MGTTSPYSLRARTGRIIPWFRKIFGRHGFWLAFLPGCIYIMAGILLTPLKMALLAARLLFRKKVGNISNRCASYLR
jgi:hypothetical protein